MKDPKQLFYAGLALLAMGSFLVIMNTEIKKPNKIANKPNAAIPNTLPTQNEPSELDKKVARNMAIGEVILMVSCLGKRGSIPRDKMGDYIAGGLEKQGISREELSSNWDFYWGFAKDAEKRTGTSCLE